MKVLTRGLSLFWGGIRCGWTRRLPELTHEPSHDIKTSHRNPYQQDQQDRNQDLIVP